MRALPPAVHTSTQVTGSRAACQGGGTPAGGHLRRYHPILRVIPLLFAKRLSGGRPPAAVRFPLLLLPALATLGGPA